jgi:hypothetical protein
MCIVLRAGVDNVKACDYAAHIHRAYGYLEQIIILIGPFLSSRSFRSSQASGPKKLWSRDHTSANDLRDTHHMLLIINILSRLAGQ